MWPGRQAMRYDSNNVFIPSSAGRATGRSATDVGSDSSPHSEHKVTENRSLCSADPAAARLQENHQENCALTADSHHWPSLGYRDSAAAHRPAVNSMLMPIRKSSQIVLPSQLDRSSTQGSSAIQCSALVADSSRTIRQNVLHSSAGHTQLEFNVPSSQVLRNSRNQAAGEAVFQLETPQTVSESSYDTKVSEADAMRHASANQAMSLPSPAPTADVVNLMECRTILPSRPKQPPYPAVRGMKHVRLCCPDVVRPTLLQVPCTKSLLDCCALPFGLLVQPFRNLPRKDLPLVTHKVITRCSLCRAYINPFAVFVSARKWRCSVCNHLNTAPDSFNAAAEQGLSCPEIENCSVEYDVPKEYGVGPEEPFTRVFVIDVTATALKSGMVAAVCQIVSDVLDMMTGSSAMRFGLITFNSRLHFYRLRGGAARAQMMTMVDTDELVLPRPSHEFLGELDHCKGLIQDLLHDLPTAHAHTADKDSCFGLAVDAALRIMGKSAGQIIAFQSSLPSVGPGSLNHVSQAEAEKRRHIGPIRDYYRALSLECARQHVSVDLFAFGPEYLSLASTACLARRSSGHMFFYNNYHHQHNPVQVNQFGDHLRRRLTGMIGVEATLRMRCTEGVTVEEFLGNQWAKSNNLLSMPTVYEDLPIGIRLSITGSLLQKKHIAVIQVALLYTNMEGKRRLRVHTIALPTSENLRAVFDSADSTAIVVLLAKMAADRCVSVSVNDSRQMVAQACCQSLRNFRQLLSDFQQTGIPAPQSLLLLPLYTSALLKTAMFQPKESCDKKIATVQLIYQLPTAVCLLMIYPSVYELHTLKEEHSLPTAGRVEYFPAVLHATRVNISADGIYLLDTGLLLLVWIGRQLSHQLILQLFGVLTFADLPIVRLGFPIVSMPLAGRVSAFVKQLQAQRSSPAPVIVIREDSSMSGFFFSCLVDDQSVNGNDSYTDFLLCLQKK